MNINFRGTYLATNNYDKLDVVVYQKTTNDPKQFFLCVTSHTSSVPQTPTHNTDNTYWAILNSDSIFPNAIDSFISRTNISASDKSSVDRFQVLTLKDTRTPQEDDELNTLTNTLRNKLISPEDFNKLQSAIQNMQLFLKDSVEGYIATKQAEFDAKLGRFTNKGEYNPTLQYYEWNTATYQGETYLCLKDSLGNTPDPNSTTIFWHKIAQKGSKGDKGDKGDAGVNLVPRGEYNPSLTYDIDDLVTYNGSAYRCIQQTTGNLPTNTTYWIQFISKGASTVATVLKNRATLSTTASNVVIGISGFNILSDALLVYVNTGTGSTYIERDKEYKINANGTSIDKFSGTWASGSVFDFIVFKNVNQDVTYADGALIQDKTISDIKLSDDIKVGSVLNLTTVDKSNIVNALNEVNSKSSTVTNDFNTFKDRFVVGSGTFNSTTGVIIPHTKGDTNYRVFVQASADPAGYLGEVYVVKSATNFKVVCSGSTTTTPFDYLMVWL